MTKYIFRFLVLTGCLVGFAPGNVLMMNFGTSSVPGGESTNSPYHIETSGFTDTTWNNLSNSDVAAGGLVYADGTTASGIGLNLGASNGGSTVDFSSGPASSGTLGADGNIYDLMTMRSTLWNGGASSSDFWVGARVDGLSAGEYEVFVWGNNGNSSIGVTPMAVYADSGAATATFNFGSSTSSAISNNNNAAWTAGISYTSLNISVSAGESLYLAIDGTNPSQSRGFLSGIQIAAVPEASTLSLMVGAVTLLLICRKRR